MESVEAAKVALSVAESAYNDAIERLAEAEAAAWMAWVDHQGRSHVASEGSLYSEKPEADRATLKAAVAETRDAEANRIRVEILKLLNRPGTMLNPSADPVRDVVKVSAQRLAADLDEFGFSGERWNGWQWFVSVYSPSNRSESALSGDIASRHAAVTAARAVGSAHRHLESAEQHAAGSAALADWDS